MGLCSWLKGAQAPPVPVPVVVVPSKPPVVVTPSGETCHGIDTSHWEPGVNWAEVAKTNAFGITKATDGTSGNDSLFPAYWSQMKAAGLIRGAFHFFHPNIDPIMQAEHFLSKVVLGAEDMMPILDWEVTGGVSPAEQQKAALAWLNHVAEKTKKLPILYSFTSFLSENAQNKELLKFPCWLAHYGVVKPHIPYPWTKVEMWQYTDKAHDAGVPQTVDSNIFYGSKDEMKAWVKANIIA